MNITVFLVTVFTAFVICVYVNGDLIVLCVHGGRAIQSAAT